MDSITWEYVRYVSTYEVAYRKYYSITSLWIIGDAATRPLMWISLN